MSKRRALKAGKKQEKRIRKSVPAQPLDEVASIRAPLSSASKLPKTRGAQALPRNNSSSGKRPFETREKSESQPERRIVQIELKTPLRHLGVRAKSPSPFRFTTGEGRHIPGLHELLIRHGLDAAHPSFRLRHPGQRRSRSQAEKDDLSRFVRLHFPPEADIQAILGELRQFPEVERADEDMGIRPAALQVDPMVGTSDQWRVIDPVTNNGFQWYIYRCGADRAWAVHNVSGQNVVIADIDAGFFLGHQDLTNVDPDHVFNAFDGTTDVTAGNHKDHGTGVLGIAGAAMNGVGIAGFAFNASLWPIQTDAGNNPPLPFNPVAHAIDWVTGEDSGGKRVVINIVVQTGDKGGNIEQDGAVNLAIRNAIAKGLVVCVAAGDGDLDAGLHDDQVTPIAPATGSILVGATDYDDNGNPRATGDNGEASNWGPAVTVCAPGDIDRDPTCSAGPDTYTNTLGGTSGAAPKVAGTIALMLEANPDLTHDEVKEILVKKGSPPDPNTNRPIGVFLNTNAAVEAALA
jgi:subtilisin family serine protease